MRLLTFILLFLATSLNAQQVDIQINGTGRTATINSGAPSSVSVNNVIPLAQAASKQQINLLWGHTPGATTYIVEQALVSDFSDAEQVFAGNALRYAATGLTQNTHYYYRISWADATTETVFATVDATTLNAGVLYDIDAEAIIAGIEFTVSLTTTQEQYIDNYVTAAKAASLWTPLTVDYNGFFADRTANSINWKNPDFNNIEGFPEMYSGAVTHSNGKISFAGVGAATELTATRAFSTNWLIPSVYLAQDDKGYTVNVTDAPTDATGDRLIFGATTNSPNVRDYFDIRCLPSGVPQNDEAGISGVNVTGSNWTTGNLPGFYVLQRSGSASGNVLFRKDGADILTSLNASTGQPAIPIGTGGYYTNTPVPNPLGYKTYGRNKFSVHTSFDGTEMSNWETINGDLLSDFSTQTFTPTTTTATTGRFLKIFGDSFSQWPASGATSGEKAWYVRLGQRFGILPITHGQGSTGYYTAINNAYANLETPSLDRMAVLVGYNDSKVFGTDGEGYEHAKSAIRAMLVNQFLGTAVAASDASVTKTGTWADPSLASSKSDNIAGNELQSSTSGDKIEYTFSGDNIVVGVANGDGTAVTYGSVAIEVDNVSQGSYSANNKAYNVTSSGGRIWNAIILSGFGPGSHTVELTLESSVNFVVDYFGTMQAANLCFPVQIADIQYDNTGTANRNANADLLTAAIKTMIAAEFPDYEDIISFPATNSFYDATDVTQVSGDDVHPLDKGYKYIYRAYERRWIP